MPDPKTYKQHFENKHPKVELPEELKEVVWKVNTEVTLRSRAGDGQ
jgi:hypothetical protein